MNTHEFVGGVIQKFGGVLRCEQCGHSRALGNVSTTLEAGWPEHCGYTMRWWTQRQIDAGEMSAIDP